MSRLIESTLTGKISNMLIEAEGKSFKEKLTESTKRCLTEKAWTELKSGAELRKAIDECDETEIEDLRHVLDILKSCCVEAKSLCKDEYYANGFQTVIDDIEMIYDDEDLDQSSVDWELDEFFDWCDSADIFVSLRESEEVKPIEKTRDELIRDHGTDNVDLINAGKEPEERVSLKESLFDEIADFMRDLDPYGYNDAYEGDDAEKHKQAVADIENDKETVKSFLQGIVDYEESTPDMIERAKYFLGALNESVEEPTAEDLEKEDEKNKAHDKKEIEDRIGELRAAIADGVSDDEKEAMEKEIDELESNLEESSKLNESNYEEPFFAEIEEALINAGFDVQRYTDAGMMTNNLGWVISNSEGEVQLTCAGTYLSEGTLKESVSVATSDGSTVDTQDAASVQSNDGSVTVVTGDTTVVINNNPTEPALDIPQEEPVEEVPVEEPIEDELTEADEDQESVISVKSLSVVKNQGNVFMLTYKDSNDNEQYVVCEDFNNKTNEGNEAETYSNKDDADKDYFARLDVNTEE